MPNKKPLTEITRELYEVLAPKHRGYGCRLLTKYEDGTFVYHEEIDPYIKEEHITKVIGHEPTLFQVVNKICEKYEAGNLVSLINYTQSILHYGCSIKALREKMPEDEALMIVDILAEWEGNGLDNQTESTLRKLHELIITNKR